MGKPSGRNSLDLKPFGGHQERCNFAIFWKTERELSEFSTGTEKEHFPGFSGIGQFTGR